MNTLPQDYRPQRRTRLPEGGLLETRVRRDGRRTSLVRWVGAGGGSA